MARTGGLLGKASPRHRQRCVRPKRAGRRPWAMGQSGGSWTRGVVSPVKTRPNVTAKRAETCRGNG